MPPTIETIAADPRYRLHHTASRRGYVSRKTSGRLALWCSGARLLGHFRRLASRGVLAPLDNSARM